ncbi:MAG: Glycerophosphoryl diester phosphodiesterase [Alphaproteobacteria bacterium MarineAlpha2_Bin1]|nr:MAG: Glycerophosphoryl diester phosphodiesterase [Alphaproteobacteria bacterium MarineAlpha2_Bin1]
MNRHNIFVLDFFISHRGASAIAPENTIASIALAKACGSRWVEVDVRFSKDRELIIFHDKNLFRITGVNSPVFTKNYKDLKNYDVGLWFNRSFEGERIPTLLDVLNFCNNNSINLNIEIKPEKGFEHSIGRKVKEIVNKFLFSQSCIMISSFDFKVLNQIEESEKVRKMILINRLPKKNFLESKFNFFQYFGLHLNIIDKKMVKYLVNLNKKVLVYTVNDPAKAKLLKSWGVTSVFTDLPKNFMYIKDN